MKAILALLLLAPTLSFACKPAGVAECPAKDRLLLRAPSLDKLELTVNQMQKTLDAAIKEAKTTENRSSCFNNHFTQHYIEGTKQYAASHKKFYCPAYMDAIERNAKDLIDPKSKEWKSVTDAKFKLMLEADAKAVKMALDDFLAAHSK
jgi:deoxyribodipyrimidine photolyase